MVDLYTGFDLTLTTRFGDGGQASGGVSLGRERTDYCDIAPVAQIGTNTDTTAGKIYLDNYTGNTINNSRPHGHRLPSSLYCAVTPPYNADWKALVSYPLKWGINAVRRGRTVPVHKFWQPARCRRCQTLWDARRRRLD